MRIYLDDNFADLSLAATLRKVGHTVFRPADLGMGGATDCKHLERAVIQDLVVLTKDRGDFEELHDLIVACGGQHPGMLIVRFENNARRDMKTRHIVAGIRRLERPALPVRSQRIVLNQWR
jgi:predicted nuclease of predicted toxin-antitoxin system